MNRARPALLALIFLATQPAWAQPSGLRLQAGSTEGLSLRQHEEGLRLRFVSVPVVDQSAPATAAPALMRSTLAADWPLASAGLRTSLGMSWNSNAGQISFGTPSTFVGLGWNGMILRDSQLSISAEFGARYAGATCPLPLTGCDSTRTNAFSGDAGGAGLRLSPYISVGATLRY